MTFSSKDLHRVAEILAAAADAEIMPRFQKLGVADVKEKSSAFDVVTLADEAAETFITSVLRSEFPGSAIIGEEAADRQPHLLNEINSADLAFLLDPIDGTKNFASGLALFGLMIAVTVRGEIVGSVIYDPVMRNWAWSVQGEGAWFEKQNEAPTIMTVAKPVPLAEMHAVAGTNFLAEPLRTRVVHNLSKFGMNFWLRCAAHEYRLAASGHCHLLVYNRLMPWDHAAGWLLHREAGGYSAHFDGSPYQPSHLTGGLICAPDEPSWLAARDTLFGSSDVALNNS